MKRFIVVLLALSSPAVEAVVPINPGFVAVPALDPWGLVGLGAAVGLVAYFARFRRR